MRHFNRAAIKEHALLCSKKCKNGKFKRVSQEFIDEVEADVESLVRKISTSATTLGVFPVVDTNLSFATGDLISVVRERLDEVTAKVIQRKVEQQPSVGQTLMRTY